METNIIHLQDELLGLLFRAVGLKEALASLPNNQKLHSAWQAAIRSVSIPALTLSEADIKVLSKLAGLEKLRFHGQPTGAVPVWRVLGPAARSLTRLRSLLLDNVPAGFTAFRNIAYAEGFATRLQELTISDTGHNLCADDLLAMVHLEALTILNLQAKGMTASAGELRSICSQLTSLPSLSLKLGEAQDVPPDALGIFPGALVGLSSLELQTSSQQVPSTTGRQQVASAVSGLTNLKELTTNWPMDTAEAQQQALGQLKQLTELFMERHIGQHAEFTMLAELPVLKVLFALSYTLTDPFQHSTLRTLAAGRLEVSEQWRGKTAEECKISLLGFGLTGSVGDASSQNMPLLPRLRRFEAYVHGDNGRYLHLASLLHRQGSDLKAVKFYGRDSFQELLPRELPACEALRLSSGFVSRSTLLLLGRCSLPRLSDLGLDLRFVPLADLVVPADLAWLRDLPALRVLEMTVGSRLLSRAPWPRCCRARRWW